MGRPRDGARRRGRARAGTSGAGRAEAGVAPAAGGLRGRPGFGLADDRNRAHRRHSPGTGATGAAADATGAVRHGLQHTGMAEIVHAPADHGPSAWAPRGARGAPDGPAGTRRGAPGAVSGARGAPGAVPGARGAPDSPAGRPSGRRRGPTGRLWCTPRTTGRTADRTGRRGRGRSTRARGSLWGPYGPQNPVPGSCRTGALRGDHGTCRPAVGRRVRSGSWLAVVPQHADRGLRRPMAIACRHKGSVSCEAVPAMAANPGGQTR